MLPAQGDRFASNAVIQLNHFEKAQEVFHSILVFGVANAGERLDPTDARDRQTRVKTGFRVCLGSTV